MTIPQPMTLNYQMYILRHPPPAGYFWLVCGSDQHGYHSWQSAYSRPENARCLEWGRRRPRARWEDPRLPAVRWPHGASYNTRHVSAPSRARAILSSIDQALKRPLHLRNFFKACHFLKNLHPSKIVLRKMYFCIIKDQWAFPFRWKKPWSEGPDGLPPTGFKKRSSKKFKFLWEKCWKAILINTKL